MKCLPSPYSYSKAGEERALHLSQVVFVRVGSRKEKVIYSRKKKESDCHRHVPLSCNNARGKKKIEDPYTK